MYRRHVLFFAVVTLMFAGCVRDVNSPAFVSQTVTEDSDSQSLPAGTQAETEDAQIALPPPELVDDGQTGQVVVPDTTPQPPLKPAEYAEFTPDKWDVPLPKVELRPGDLKTERSPEVEARLKQALKNIENGDLSFLDQSARESVSTAHLRPSREAAKSNAKGKSVAKKSASKPAANLMLLDGAAAMPAAESASVGGGYGIGASGGGGVLGAASLGFGSGGGGYGEASLEEIAALLRPELITDEYSQYDPNRFMSTLTNPLSTFGADVDTASYTVFRRAINEGRVPRNQGLRAEEMINYFRYDYPNPKGGEPFSVTTEVSSCPWNPDTKLLLVGAKTRELRKEERPASNIVFLFDSSGSMRGNDRLNLLKASVISMLPKLTANDKVSIVTYSGAERFIIDGVPGDHHATILKALDYFQASGATNGQAGIQMAYAVAKKNFIKGGNNRIIMGTDGDLNVGISSATELKALIEKKRESGVFLSVLGVGMGNYKDNRLEALADYGNGSYHYIDSLREGRRVLAEEFMSTVFVVAKDVKFQVDFNPSKIKGYRQIGYETRRLNAEDFADDKKDGGEVGAGHQVTILYEIVEEGSPVNVPEPTSKYQKVEAVKSDEYATVKLRYKQPDGDVSTELSWPVTSRSVSKSMSDNLKFASSVAAVSMILNQSEFKGNVTYNTVLQQLNEISSLKNDEYRVEFVDLVKKLSKM